MKQFWDERYASKEYIYGIEPNEFFKRELLKLTPGKILLPAEGEGRNAVYAAESGWSVTSFDSSSKGITKALSLAKSRNVELNYIHCDYETFDSAESFDCLGLFYAHIPSRNRRIYHRKLISYLVTDSIVILEAFSKEQLGKSSGGPKDSDMLYSIEDLQEDFNDMTTVRIFQEEAELNEGEFHKGLASLIRMIAIK